jgi:hypothetical protein
LGGTNSSVYVHVTVSSSASTIETVAVARSVLVALCPFCEVHCRPANFQFAGTSSCASQGASPGSVSARTKLCCSGWPSFTASENSPFWLKERLPLKGNSSVVFAVPWTCLRMTIVPAVGGGVT